MEPIYVLKNNKTIIGPLSFEKLKSKGVKESDKFWFAGLPDWTVASEIQAFSELPRLVPARPKNIFRRMFSFLR